MNDSPIDDYVNQVDKHLKLRGKARKQALDDLRDALNEAVQAIDEAIALTGSPQDYAAALDEQFAADRPRFKTILGMPNSFTRGIGQRIAGTFDPSNPALIIPRVFGLGWTINTGAVAVRLGLLNPDDVDDEILADAGEHLAGSQLAAAIPIIAAALATARFGRRRRETEQVTGKSQKANLIAAVGLTAACAVLLAASADREIPAAQRVAMPSAAAALGTVVAGASLQSAIDPRGHTFVFPAIALMLPVNLLLSYLPIRAALNRSRSSASES